MPITNEPIQKMMMTPKQELFKCPIFTVHSRKIHSLHSQTERDIYLLSCAHWVNIVPVLPNGNILLIEQHRFGNDEIVLETPGGAIDPHEKDATLAALRELEEETGYTSDKLIGLPFISPNPAIEDNLIYYFIAFDLKKLPHVRDSFDEYENIRIKEFSLPEAIQRARQGQINHALSCLALLLAEPYIQNRHAL